MSALAFPHCVINRWFQFTCFAGTPYQKAKKVLHTAKPDRLVCREKETEQITKFLEENISGGTSGSLYISGAPGTGKTAVLTTVIDKIQVSAS